MLSEIATNAVQHAATEFEVEVEIIDDGRVVRVAVTDGAHGFPSPETAGDDAARGRGLQIVGTLADAWGVDVQRDPAGKTVWFSSHLPAEDLALPDTPMTALSRCEARPVDHHELAENARLLFDPGVSPAGAGPGSALDVASVLSHELQRNLVPTAIPDVGGWDVAARSRPASVGHQVGGDWYDVVPVTDDLVALVVGDVEGHDLGAAKTMGFLRRTLGMLLREERSPGRALRRLNQFCLLGAEPRLATALIGVLDRSSGVISFSSAGHPPPVHIREGRAKELPVPPAPPLGVQPCHYKDHTFLLDDGCLVMFTDGLLERRGMHFDERLAMLESSLGVAPMDDPGLVADHVMETMTADGRTSDDIVVLTARRHMARVPALL